MRSTLVFTAAILGAFGYAAAQQVKVFNPSFEVPVAPAASGIVTAPSAANQGAGPSDSPWVFTQGETGVVASGVNLEPGGFTAPQAPDGNQWAFINQPPPSTTISQALMFPSNGDYTLTFDAALSTLFVRAAIDNLGTLDLTQGAPSLSGVVPFSATFNETAGMHTLIFENVDNTVHLAPDPPVLIDAVKVTPEPAVALLAISMLVMRRRRAARPLTA